MVTLTGDGLMDALALKQSDIGVAVDSAGASFFKVDLKCVTKIFKKKVVNFFVKFYYFSSQCNFRYFCKN